MRTRLFCVLLGLAINLVFKNQASTFKKKSMRKKLNIQLELYLLNAILIFSFSACNEGAINTPVEGQSTITNTNSSSSTGSTCACSTTEARSLAYKYTAAFDKIQNELPSDVARVIRVESVEERNNCAWVVTFKVSWPFGNTDGAHPDEYLKKRYACDGKEVYEL